MTLSTQLFSQDVFPDPVKSLMLPETFVLSVDSAVKCPPINVNYVGLPLLVNG